MDFSRSLTFINTMVLVALLVGCNRTAVDDHNHDADAATVESLSYTRYSDKTELFVEFHPLVVGTETKVAAHFTVLGALFQPLTEAKLTLSLEIGDKVVRQRVELASSPGIFRFALTPTQAGTGSLVFAIETPAYADQIIIDKITVYPDLEAARNAQPDPAPADEITYLKEQAWKTEFAHEPAVRTTFTDVLKTVGQVQHAPGEQVVVSANASGYVSLIGNNTIVGSTVARSTAMFRISGGDLAENNLDARYREAKATYEKATQDLERAKKLVENKIISQADFIRYQNAFEVAEIAFKTTSKNYTASGQVISSPLNGFVTSLLVQEGQYVQAGSPLAVVSSQRKLHLQANVSTKYASTLEKITTANFKPVGYDRVLALSELKGRRIAYGQSTTSSSAFLPITFEFDNPGDLVPGTAAEVYLKTFPRQEVLVLPVSALLEEQGVHYVYVQTGGERFQRRTVTLGASDGQRVHIISGIVEGERVVTKGAYQIKLATASGAFPEHGH